MALPADAAARIEQLATGADTSALVAFLEQFELDLGHAALAPATSLSVYKVHLAAYLMCEQLDDARFLWKRLPAEPRDADAEICALWAIGKAMWIKDIAGAQAAMGAYQWTPTLLSGLLERMRGEHLQRSFAQCGRAYSLVSADHLASTLGVASSKVSELADAAGWTSDAETGAYVPASVEEPAGKVELMAQLKVLTDYVAHVEKEVK